MAKNLYEQMTDQTRAAMADLLGFALVHGSATKFHANLRKIPRLPEGSTVEDSLTAYLEHVLGAATPQSRKMVGTAEVMPGTPAFTCAVFEASNVPEGTMLYMQKPSESEFKRNGEGA